jgi:hypothetical protein
MYLYNEGETKSQGRFFSPSKIKRIRERTAIVEETQR